MLNNLLLRNHVLFIIALNVTALILIILSFTFIDNPFDKQAKEYDQQRITSIERLKSKIDEYYQINHQLPESLHSLEFNSYENKENILSDPKTHEEYEYHTSSDRNYEICATFAKSSKNNTKTSGVSVAPAAPKPLIMPRDPYMPIQESYDHPAGYYCMSFSAPYVAPTPYYPPYRPMPTYYPLPGRLQVSPVQSSTNI